jgi:hypothetical protein
MTKIIQYDQYNPENTIMTKITLKLQNDQNNSENSKITKITSNS